jgi:hypothetical protein
MKFVLVIAIGAALIVAGCGGDNDEPEPSAIGQQAEEVQRAQYMAAYPLIYSETARITDCAELRAQFDGFADIARNAERIEESWLVQMDAAHARMRELDCYD